MVAVIFSIYLKPVLYITAALSLVHVDRNVYKIVISVDVCISVSESWKRACNGIYSCLVLQ